VPLPVSTTIFSNFKQNIAWLVVFNQPQFVDLQIVVLRARETFARQWYSQLTSGDTLTISSDGCTNAKGQSVLKFSRQFLNTIETQKQEGYHLKQAKVNFIVYWKKEDAAQESKVILPELIFERQDN